MVACCSGVKTAVWAVVDDSAGPTIVVDRGDKILSGGDCTENRSGVIPSSEVRIRDNTGLGEPGGVRVYGCTASLRFSLDLLAYINGLRGFMMMRCLSRQV